MSFTEQEFDAFLAARKVIRGDINWTDDQDHSPNREFRIEAESDAGDLVHVVGSWNPRVPAVSYVVIHPQVGRIYGLDLGKDHHNPTCERIGEVHKHTWTDLYKDGHGYAPKDITAEAVDPVMVWEQFCTEANMEHEGRMHPPPQETGRLPLL